jgi:hypothetical protein
LSIPERAGYAACLVAAIALRFAGLGREPLSLGESVASWPAWWLSVGRAGAPPMESQPTSALLFSLQSLVFWLAGTGSDALARVPSAVAGSVIVLAPVLGRSVLGRAGALALAALLAVDPVLLAASRSADGGALLGAGAAMFAVGCLARFADSDRDPAAARWLDGAAIALGLLLISGPQAWTLLLLVVATVSAMWRRPALRPVVARRIASSRPTALAGLALSSALIGATTGLAQWRGPAFVGTSLAAWFAPFAAPAELIDGPRRLVDTLVRAQFPLVVLAIVGVVLVRWPHDARGWRAWIPHALAVTLVFGLACGPTLAARVPATLVLALAATRGMTAIIRLEGSTLRQWSRAAVVAVLLVMSVRPVTQAIGLTEDRAAWLADNDTDPAIRQLVHDVARMGAWRAGDAREHPVSVVASPWADPLVGWYLRELTRLRWVLAVEAPRDATSPPLIVTQEPADAASADRPPRLPGDYAGIPYRIRRASTAAGDVVLWVP